MTDDAARLGAKVRAAAELEASMRRALSPISTENQRVGELGPALFAVIVIGVVAILLCCTSSFIDHAPTRRKLRTIACFIVVLPVLFFSTSTYVTDTSQLSSSRKYDVSHRMRFIVLSSGCFSLCMGLLSLFAGAESPMLMHRQGRNVANVLTKSSY